MPPQQPQQPQGDNSLAALWITVFFFALFGAIWYLFHAQIVWFVFWIKYWQAVAAGLFSNTAIGFAQKILTLNPANANLETFLFIVQQVGQYVRYPAVIILVSLAILLYFTHPTLRFKKKHSMKTLYEQEKFNWPQITPVSHVDLVKESIDKGPWAMALTPMQFAKKYRLIVEEREKIQALGAKRESITVTLARADTYQVFATQLGPFWAGMDKLPMHTKALFTVFILRIHHKEDDAKKVLDQLASSSATGSLDFTGIEEILKKYKEASIIKWVTARHAYVMTLMAALLETARLDGVLACADFLWLKVVDRPLWYMLNSVGRQTAFVEVGGAFSHWLAEKKLGRKINVPMVEEAVKALDIALKEVIYVPDSEKENT